MTKRRNPISNAPNRLGQKSVLIKTFTYFSHLTLKKTIISKTEICKEAFYEFKYFGQLAIKALAVKIFASYWSIVGKVIDDAFIHEQIHKKIKIKNRMIRERVNKRDDNKVIKYMGVNF